MAETKKRSTAGPCNCKTSYAVIFLGFNDKILVSLIVVFRFLLHELETARTLYSDRSVPIQREAPFHLQISEDTLYN